MEGVISGHMAVDIKSPSACRVSSLLDGRRGHERLLEGGGRLRPRPERATVDEEEGHARDAPPRRRLRLAPRRLLQGLGRDSIKFNVFYANHQSS